MINIAALTLLVSSLASAGVWSPPPDNPHLIREGHRLIVVEYERHIPSDQTPPPPKTSHGVIGEAKDRFQEASSLLPNVGQGIATPESADGVKPGAHSAKDLICDAYGSCKEKISNAFHMGKERISRKASDIEESAAVAVDRAKEKASDIKESVKERASEIEESAKDAVKTKMEDAKDAVKGKIEGAKDGVRSKMDSMKDSVKSTVESAKDAVKSAADVTRDAEHDLSANISRAAGQAVDRAEDAANMLHRNLTDIVSRAKDVAIDAAKYVGAPATARDAASIAHLVAFAVAYGTCVWVTFVSSHVLATALPRQQFGIVQSKLYPVYFRAMAYGVGIACLGHFFARERVVGIERVQGYNLLAALGLVLVNMFYLEPEATKVMFERMKMEKEEGRGRDMADVLGDTTPVMTATTTTATTQSASTIGVTKTTQSASTIGMTKTTVGMDQEAVKGRAAKLNQKLRKLNGHSSFVNILTLMSLTWHLVHLGRRLQMTCTSV